MGEPPRVDAGAAPRTTAPCPRRSKPGGESRLPPTGAEHVRDAGLRERRRVAHGHRDRLVTDVEALAPRHARPGSSAGALVERQVPRLEQAVEPLGPAEHRGLAPTRRPGRRGSCGPAAGRPRLR